MFQQTATPETEIAAAIAPVAEFLRYLDGALQAAGADEELPASAAWIFLHADNPKRTLRALALSELASGRSRGYEGIAKELLGAAAAAGGSTSLRMKTSPMDMQLIRAEAAERGTTPEFVTGGFGQALSSPILAMIDVDVRGEGHDSSEARQAASPEAGLAAIDRLPFPVTMVERTGGGYHGLIVTDSLTSKVARSVMNSKIRAWVKRQPEEAAPLDTGVQNLTAAIRIPGTAAGRKHPGQVVEVLRWDTPVSIEEVEAWSSSVSIKEKKARKPVQKQTTARAEEPITTGKPLDAFSAREGAWEQILERVYPDRFALDPQASTTTCERYFYLTESGDIPDDRDANVMIWANYDSGDGTAAIATLGTYNTRLQADWGLGSPDEDQKTAAGWLIDVVCAGDASLAARIVKAAGARVSVVLGSILDTDGTLRSADSLDKAFPRVERTRIPRIPPADDVVGPVANLVEPMVEPMADAELSAPGTETADESVLSAPRVLPGPDDFSPHRIPAPVQALDDARRQALLEQTRALEFDDVGMAQRWAAIYGPYWRFVVLADGGYWRRWTGKAWATASSGDLTASVRTLITEWCEVEEPMSYPRAPKIEGETPDWARHRHSAQSWRTSGKMKSVMEQLPSMEGIAVSPAAFDARLDAINCADGTLDLRTLELRPHDASEMFTTVTAASGQPAPMTADLQKLLDGYALTDPAIPAFFQMIYGAALTGRSPRAFMHVYGEPNTGKSTLVEALIAALGGGDVTNSQTGLAALLEASAIMKAQPGAPRPSLMAAKGKRLLLVEELSNVSLDENVLKQLVSSGIMAARELHRSVENWRSQAVLVATGNETVRLSATDAGTRSRFYPVPLTIVPPYDGTLDLRLQREAVNRDALLYWAAQGAARFLAAGGTALTIAEAAPAIVREAREGYLAESNPLQQFFLDKLADRITEEELPLSECARLAVVNEEIDQWFTEHELERKYRPGKNKVRALLEQLGCQIDARETRLTGVPRGIYVRNLRAWKPGNF